MPFRLAVLLIGAAALTVSAQSGTPRFFPDDPIAVVPETQDASGAKEYDIDLAADLLLNSFGRPGDGRIGTRAGNLNTVDEVPDSSWFTNRIGARPVSRDELLKGPNTMDGPAPGRWTVIRPKSSGYAPGFTVRDSRGEVWFLSFDPKNEPNAATGAIAVAARLFWALGYHQVESYLATTRLADLDVADTATVRIPGRRRRRMTIDDVERVLERAARSPDGSYRVLAGRSVPGRVLGGFRYHSTRPDDPNDIVPHEHRRELRALKVFGAWTNLVDIKAGNTLDTVITQNGRGIVRHYLQDVGSTFGTGALGPREWDEGWEYLYEGGPLWKRLVSLGFYRSPWQEAQYERVPEVGRFEGDTFDPLGWRTRVPAAALAYARDDDTFWAALRVAAFSDEMLQAVAGAAQYRDPKAAAFLAGVLGKRRDKIVKTYLPRVNPIVDLQLAADGTLTFDNAAVRHGAAAAPRGGYRAVWARFDNATGRSTPFGAPTTATAGRMTAPMALPGDDGAFVEVAVSAIDMDHPAWNSPVRAQFRRMSGQWTLVGLTRLE